MRFLSLKVFCAAAMCVLCFGKRVFFQCGAKLDISDVQGLVLSPGFPDNYSSGSHCIWQFFVPAGHQLTMEMFDFDVFESSERSLSRAEDVTTSEDEEHLLNKGLIRSQPALQEQSTDIREIGEGSNSMVWNTTQRLCDPPEPQTSDNGQEHAQNSTFPSSVEDNTEVHLPPSSTPANIVENESETLQLLKDVCPDDVLYITDLITFSSRFCGSKRPSDDRLVFGSDVEMVEVIMELITNTHRGRGFALIFRYHNRTAEAAVEVGVQRSSAPSVGAVEALLAAVSLVALLALSLMIVLCVTLRPKLCVKASTMTTSITSEVPGQNLHTDDSELQLVTANVSEQELNKHKTLPHTGNALLLPHTGKAPVCQSSQNVVLDCSDGLMEMELGADEVFVISNTTTPSFSPCTHERFLRHCDTGSVQPSDWMPHSEPSNWPSRGSHVGSARPRAWSVRTFHDFLLPLPQLNRKWCSWNLTSPFTKLVDTVSPGSDGVKVPSAPNQQRYNSSRSHTSEQLCEPDAALCGLEQGVEVKICRFSAAAADDDDDNLTIPVFAISEEDDREPLVSAEHQNQEKNCESGNCESFPTLGSTHFTVEELDVYKNSSKIQLPSLSHVTVPCDSVGKDI
ncbi:uncharacterized protein si:dkey-112e17.1 isoform X2 [Tachysurus fulvidraco]|uniref:uncharacterized protein si:dkey-112e17.1 isoform X2 n=1 Tax=Tachysurus fulvidraco TaxID=1234273 RepID=UPI001FEF4573|nr:uncharacterized protein si:dkey-112e17.1 isoform X2 [Tachysurus fulvidraco]